MRTVVIVDDHAMFRAGVRSELAGAVDVVAEASDVPTAVAAVLTHRPEVVLIAGGGDLQLGAPPHRVMLDRGKHVLGRVTDLSLRPAQHRADQNPQFDDVDLTAQQLTHWTGHPGQLHPQHLTGDPHRSPAPRALTRCQRGQRIFDSLVLRSLVLGVLRLLRIGVRQPHHSLRHAPILAPRGSGSRPPPRSP